MQHVVNEALNDWMNIVGEARLKAFDAPALDKLRNLVQMPKPKS